VQQIIDPLNDLSHINPLLLLLLAALLYGALLFVRHQGVRALIVAWTVLCASLVLMPAGKETLTHVQSQPTAVEKVQCLGRGVVRGSLWNEGKAKRIPECQFRGFAFSNQSAEDLPIIEKNSQDYLNRRFGRVP
jgi:hypothetical protein